MVYRIDLSYEPSSAHIDIQYDRELQGYVSKNLSVSDISRTWPSQLLPARTISYMQYDSISELLCSQMDHTLSTTPSTPCSESSQHYELVHIKQSPSQSALQNDFAIFSLNEEYPCQYSLGESENYPNHYEVARPLARLRIMQLLDRLQQGACKTLAKELIKIVIPLKKTAHPYKGGNQTKPAQWPRDIPHRQPDHISKQERISLVTHFACKVHPQKLELVLASLKGQVPSQKHIFLAQILELAASEWHYTDEQTKYLKN